MWLRYVVQVGVLAVKSAVLKISPPSPMRAIMSLPAVTQVRTERGRCVVVLGDTELQVSRRHTRELRDRLLRLPGRRRGT